MKKLLSLSLAAVMLFILVGCNKYNATFYDNAHLDMKEEFLEAYPVNIYDRTAPKKRYFVIESQEQLDEAFENFYTEVDFQTEMVIIYMFTDYNAGFECSLAKIELESNKLFIKFLHFTQIGPTGSAPTQRCLVVKMEKVEFDSIEFKMKYKNIWRLT